MGKPKVSALICGIGITQLNSMPPISATNLMIGALGLALRDADLALEDVDGLIGLPALSEPHSFMQAHQVATLTGLLPKKRVIVRTIDTGGAGPVTALLEARRMVQCEGRHCVAVVAGDAVGSMRTRDFLAKADGIGSAAAGVPSPYIPHAYDRIAQWQMRTHGVRREELAMCASLMSLQGSRHPQALATRVNTVDEVLGSKQIAPVTTVLECARRADGGAAFLVTSRSIQEEHGIPASRCVEILGGGEASGPLWPPETISEDMFSCREAAESAYAEAKLQPADIDYFSLYDCFPVCLLRALEAVGLAPSGQGGAYVRKAYAALVDPETRLESLSERPQAVFPVNTHGGLLGFGAPWETPAMYGIAEAVVQLRGMAESRQVENAKNALVYGNGGIFSSSAVAILGKHGRQLSRL